MKNVILKYGVIAGAIVSSMLFITSNQAFLAFEYGEIFGFAMMIIAFSTIFFAVKSHRDLSGEVTFGRAFKLGLGVALVASVLYTAVWMIMMQTIAKDFMAEYYQFSVDKLKTSDLSEAEIASKLAEMEEFKEVYKNPLVQIGVTLLEIFPVGMIMALIAALIFRKKK